MAMITFEATPSASGQIEIPAEVAAELPQDTRVQVTVHWGGNDDGLEDWKSLGLARFEAAYGPEDAIYDNYLNEPPIR